MAILGDAILDGILLFRFVSVSVPFSFVSVSFRFVSFRFVPFRFVPFRFRFRFRFVFRLLIFDSSLLFFFYSYTSLGTISYSVSLDSTQNGKLQVVVLNASKILGKFKSNPVNVGMDISSKSSVEYSDSSVYLVYLMIEKKSERREERGERRAQRGERREERAAGRGERNEGEGRNEGSRGSLTR